MSERRGKTYGGREFDPQMVTGRTERFLRIGWLTTKAFTSYYLYKIAKPILPHGYVNDIAEAIHEMNAKSLYKESIALKGAFLKVGQILSSRPDIFPDAYGKHLGGLTDSVPSLPYEVVVETFMEEFGRSPDEIFASFDETPCSAASLGQVHKAVLKSGEKVAVKVQFPFIEEIVKHDMKNLDLLTSIFGKAVKEMDFVSLNEELQKLIPLEVDYHLEANNAERMKANFVDKPHIIIPKVYREFSTKKVLTLEFIEGLKLSDLIELTSANPNMAKQFSSSGQEGEVVNEFVRLFSDAYCQMVLRDGFFHADPHPGNFFVMPGPKIGFVDFGCMKEFPPHFQTGFGAIAKCILEDDLPGLAQAFKGLGFETLTGDMKPLEGFAKLFMTMFKPIDTSEQQAIMQEIRIEMRDNPVVKIPSDFMMLGRVFIYLSNSAWGGLADGIDPTTSTGLDSHFETKGLNLQPIIEPYLKELSEKA